MIVALVFKMSRQLAGIVAEVLHRCRHIAYLKSHLHQELIFFPLRIGNFEQMWRRIKGCTETKFVF